MVRGAARSPFALSLLAVAVFAVVKFPQILELAAALVVLNVVLAGNAVVNQAGDNLEHGEVDGLSPFFNVVFTGLSRPVTKSHIKS
jgi:hypothetical protein